jgi:hypothetical protein
MGRVLAKMDGVEKQTVYYEKAVGISDVGETPEITYD